MRLTGVAVWRSVLGGALISIAAGLATPANGQIVTATGSVKLSGDPNLVPSVRKPVTYTSSASSANASLTAAAFDKLSSETEGSQDGWADELHLNISPNSGTPFQIVLFGVRSNITTGSFCQSSGGRTTCDPEVALLSTADVPLCQVTRSSFAINKLKLGYGGTLALPNYVFVYSLGGTFSAQCAGETLPITGSFNLNQTTTEKFLTAPRTNAEPGTARCDGAGGWPNAEAFGCETAAAVPTADLPRSGTFTLTLTADQGADLGRIQGGKTYRLGQNDGPWFSYLRDPFTEVPGLRDYNGDPPRHIELTLVPQGDTRDKTGISHFSFKQREAPAIDLGTFAFDDAQGVPHMELQINLSFCGGGVTSTYTVDEYTYDCEFAEGGLPPEASAPAAKVHVVPHLRSFKITFRTQCGDEKGAFRGTLTIKDTPGFDCGFPPTTGGGGTGSGGTGGITPPTGGDPGSGTGGTTPTSPGNGPTVIIPDSIRTDGIQLNNLQSVTVNLSTAIPSGFNSDVELAVFSEPEGLAVSLSKSAIAAPGAGTSVLTIAAGADTRPQDYKVLISATGNGVTTFNLIKVSVFCDPPTILGIDQPRNVTITSGASTTLEANANGSAPAAYQWYGGQTGATQNPIAGAINRTFNTGALTSTSDYWVRVTNPCGSVDSNTVTVTVH